MKTITKLSFIISVLTFLISSITYAEGTPSLSPNPANLTAVLVAPDILSGAYSNCPEDNRIYFNIANAGTERLYFGFDWRGYSVGSPLRLTNLYYRIKNPSGTVVLSGRWNEVVGSAGNIDTHAKAIAGPNISGSTPTGYTPLLFNPAVAGEHWIEFYRSDDGGLTANAQRGVSAFFDLTVATPAGVRRSGRIHSDKWAFVAVDTNFGNTPNGNSEPNFYAYTNDQVVLLIDFRPGFQPIAYNLAVNSYGVTATGPFNITRRSINSALAPSLLNGYKVFLNNPDSTLYPIAAVPLAPTFLNPAITGCGSLYQINYNITNPGDVRLLLDINGIPGYQPLTSDRIIEVYGVAAGNNLINWNGLDGLGNLVPDGAPMSLSLFYLSGRFNLPLFDVELNKQGFNVQSIAPVAIPNSQMYWDDTQLTNVGSSCSADITTFENNLTGSGIDNSINGLASPTRAWSGNSNPTNIIPAPAIGANETDGIPCNDYGNVRVLNTWGWGLSTQSVSTSVFKGCTDLRVVKTASTMSPNFAGQLTFTITASNLGVSNDTNVVLNDVLPTGYTYVSNTPPTLGTFDSATGVWTIGNFANLANATITITATVNLTGNYSNTATITGQNFDPNLLNNTSTVTPVPVNAAIDAVNDTIASINGINGNSNAGNVLTSNGNGPDTLNGNPVIISQVNISIVTPATPLTPGAPVPSVDPLTGVISIPANTPAGSYTITYQICQIANPTNCDTAVVTVPVIAAAINAIDDFGTSLNGFTGGTSFTNVLINDTLNGIPVLASQVNTTQISSTHPGVSLSGNNVIVAPGTPAGNYILTYQICEILNPTNCDTAIVRVPVFAAAIIAQDDTMPSTIGLVGNPSLGNVLPSNGNGPDTLNGTPLANLALVNMTVVTPATPIGGGPVPTLNTTTGLVSVPVGTPAGTYTITYQICEILNPANCDTAIVTIPVTAATIDAVNDTVASSNGTNGNPNAGNVLTPNGNGPDTLNGVPVTISQVNITVVTPATPLTLGAPVPSVNPATGVISIPANTPAGTYTITYQICEILNPTNCDTAIVTIPVTAAAIVAQDDTLPSTIGLVGNPSLGNVLPSNGNGPDTLNGTPLANLALVNMTVVTPATPIGGGPVPTLNTTTGLVSVPVGTPAGTYTITYQICQILNPTNCDTAIVTIPVTSATIDAVNDTVASSNGTNGNPNAGNVLTSNGNGPDTLNGVPVTISQVNITVVTPATPLTPGAPVPSVNPATGVISIPANTPAGTYTITYQICEILNPTNCDTAIVTVPVGAAAIVAQDDTMPSTIGLVGNPSLGNVLPSNGNGPDTLNGTPLANLALVNMTVVTPATPIGGGPVPTLNTTTGLVSVPVGTPAGTYTITYQICQILNPTNCDTAIVTIPVTAATIDAVNDTVASSNGTNGNPNAGNVLTPNGNGPDTLNGVPVTISQVNITVVTPATPLTPGAPVPSVNPATGVISIPANTPAGTYTITYQICEILNPTNCDTAIVTVPVGAAAIVAQDDTMPSTIGLVGNPSLGNVLPSNGNGPDTLNGTPLANLALVNMTVVTPATPIGGGPVPTLNTTTGLVSVPVGTPAGTYTITYQICQILNPTNCDTAIVTIPVTSATIDAVNDTVASSNGTNGNPNAGNVLTPNGNGPDTLNGVPVTISQVNITVVTPATPLTPGAPVPSVNPATGVISIPANTPAGTYTITYQICEILNPTNCDTAIVTVPVGAAAIVAQDDTMPSTIGLVGNPSLGNVLPSNGNGPDTLNGTPLANLALVNMTVVTPATPIGGGAVPTLNTTTGLVSVPVGTPAGTYTITYQICQILNPTNCDTAIVTIPVTAATIDAVNDTVASSNGTNGNPNAGNVLTPNGNGPDTLNGVPVTISQVNITVVTPATPLTPGAPVPSVNPATGVISIPANTPAGTYTITYQICEILNPTNCDTAIVTVPVGAAAIVAQDDTMPSTIGLVGNPSLGNVLPSNGNGPDTLNGTPLANLALVNMTVVTPATPIGGGPVPTLNTTTGLVSVPVGTPAGTYTITYQICQILNPTNCDTAIVTIPVTSATIDAVNDTVASSNGTNGNPNAGNVLTPNGNGPDTLNGVPVTISQVNITVVTPATPLTPGAPVPSVNPATGVISIPANTPAGTYTITYQICEILNPTNCDTAIVTVPVGAAAIVAQDDTMPSTIGLVGNPSLGNVLPSNGNGPDTLNGTPLANLALVNMTVVTPATPIGGGPVPTLNTTTGLVSVPVGTPAGTYTITYQICEILNPANCDTAIVTIPVTSATIDAVNDTVASSNGTNGNPNAGNVLTPNGNGPDTLNGVPVTISQVNITVVTPATPLTPGAPVPSVNPATGVISIPVNTPAGTYTITYQICEILNPTNCDTAIVTVPVGAAAIVAQDDTMPSTIGLVGNPSLGNVLPSNGNGPDTLNGTPLANLALVNMTVVTPATPIGGGPVPTLNTTTGLVSVPVGTPAGTYTITYQICQILNPTNCDTAIVTIPVTAATIDAVNDTVASSNGTNGNPNAGNVLTPNGNGPDTLNGVPVTISQVNITVVTPATPLTPGAPVPSVNPATGVISIPANTPAGTYTITYQICEILNPTNCDTAIVTVPVGAAAIIAQDDTLSSTNGLVGNPSLGNVLPNNGNGPDTLNGTPLANLALVNMTVVTPATPIGGGPVPTLNTTTGLVSVPVGTPASTYTITYQICEILNPANCDTAIVTIPVYTPSIQLFKNGVYNDSSLPAGANVGDTVIYNFTVVNTGSAPLTNVTVSDPLVTVMGGPIPVLAIGQTDTTTFTATYILTQADIDAGQVNNLATATGTPPSGPPVTDTSSDPTPCGTCTPVLTCPDCTLTPLPIQPAIELLKDGTYVDSVLPAGVSVGDTITYAFTVTNIGNVTLTNITVTDPLVTVIGGPLASLAVGASDSTTFAATYTITQVDIDAGQVENLATATGNPPSGPPVTDTSSDPTPCTTCTPCSTPDCTITDLPQTPAIQLLKDGTYVDSVLPAGVSVGDTITYAFTVTNIGNVTLTNITVTDPLVTVIGGPLASLAVGASDSTTFTATYTITQADIDAGQVDNLATATGTPPSGPPVTDTSSDPTPCTTCTPLDPNCTTCTITTLPSAPAIQLLKDGTYVDSVLPAGVSVGDTITYAFTVTNIGNVTLTNITVTDPLVTVIGGPLASLAVGASDSTTFTATYTITQADIDAGQVDNLATATGNPPSGPPVTDTSSDPTPCTTCTPLDPNCTTCTITTLPSAPAIQLLKDGTYVDSVLPAGVSVGDTITYAFTVTNIGNVTLTNITVTDPLVTVIGGPLASLAVGASDSTTFTATYTITQADIDAGQVDNLATATGNPPSGPPVTDTSSDPTPCTTCTPLDPNCTTCTITTLPSAPAIQLLKDGTYVDSVLPAGVSVGDTITYAFTVTNIGNVTLTNITVTDPLVTVIGGPLASLAVGASDSTTFTATYTITQADIDAGQVDNLATATGNPPSGPPVTDTSSDPTPCTTCTPLDPNCTTCTITTLPSAPAIQLLKDGTYVDSVLPAGVSVGDTITYAFTVTNIGNVTLTNITVTDPLVTVIGGPLASLAVGASDSTTFTATYTITQADIDAGQVDNLATATGNPPSGPPVTDTSSDPTPCTTCTPLDPNCTTCTITTLPSAPAIQLLKDGTYVDSVLPAGVSVGDTITYAFTVTNIGNVTLTNITVTDPLVTVIGGPLASLAVGASDSTTFTATYTITQADIDAGQVDNLATATGNPPSGPPVTDTSSDPTPCTTCTPLDPNCTTCTITTLPSAPAIQLLKDGTYVDSVLPAGVSVGDTITYAFTVTNIGNVTLTNITVTDPLVTVIGGPLASLAVGASDSTTFTATYTITQVDIDAGQVDNLATATGNPPSGPPVTDTSSDPTPCTTCTPLDPNCTTCTITTLPSAPAIQLLKDGTYVDSVLPAGVSVGDTITYAFTVTNIGNVTLTNITVTDPLVTVIGGPLASLAVGASDSTTFTATYTITQADIDAGQVDNLATATGNPPSGPPVTDTSSDPTPCTTCTPLDPNCTTCTITTLPSAPAIQLLKDGTYVDSVLPAGVSVGDTITYAFTVTNIGNVTLTNITVTDPLVTVIGGPLASLAVGASDSTTFTATYTITQVDIDAGQVDNLATATGNPPSGPPVTDTSSDPTPCTTCTPLDPNCTTCTITTLPSAPAIQLLKDGTYVDSVLPAGVSVGDTITYAFTVTNIGNVTLTNITVTDPLVTVIGGPLASLAVGASDSTTFTATYTITQADIDAGQVDNLATATGNPPSGPPVTDTSSDPTPCTTCTPLDPNCTTCTITTLPSAPAIQLLKDGTYVDNNVDGITNVGDTITYTFTVTNTGNVTLTNVTITDPLVTVIGGPLASLAVGASDSTTFTAIYSITQADIDAGNVYNLATATGNPPSGPPVTDTSSDPTPCSSCPADPNCPTCTITPLIDAVNDIYNSIACDVNSVVGNVMTNDTIANIPVNTVSPLTNVNFTLLSGSYPNISIDANGNINVTAGITVGTYTFTYSICSILTPNMCDQATVTVNIIDDVDPFWTSTLPGDVTVSCDNIPQAPTLTAQDICSTVIVDFNQSIQNGNCPGNYVIIRTWTATDASGNSIVYTQTITVQDLTPPTFVETLPANVTVECSNIPVAAVLTANDNCGNATVNFVQTITQGNCEGNYVITRTWTAVDLCDNQTVHVQTITVQDTTDPVFVEVLPADITVECSNIPVAPILTATDNCGLANVNYLQTIEDGNCPGNYIITRRWIAIDPCGNTTIHLQTITVQDTTPPTFVEILPSNITVECSNVPTPVVLTAIDNCGTATVTFAQTNTPGTCAGNYIITRTWTATDLCGLQTVHVQTITVQDTTPPTFIEPLPTNIIVECSNVPAPLVLTATDNCGTATVIFAQTNTPGTCAGNYTITRTWTATDLCGLQTVYVQTITVQDTTAPTFVEPLPTNITVECSNVPAPVVLTAIDNCGIATVTFVQTNNPGTCAGNYTITRTWTATDLCGLQTIHVQTITVQDTTAPTFVEILPSNITVECSNVPAPVVLTATDNCGTAVVTFVQTNTPGTCSGNYTITRTWTATDLCGLQTIYVQTITVQDTTAPTFVEALPSNITVECSNVPAPVVLSATDNCGTASVTFNEVINPGACAGSYTIIRTWTATDLCGLQTVHVQTITVQDTTAPTFVETLPTNLTVECTNVPTPVVLTANDNCGIASVTFNEINNPGTCAGSYTLIRTWTATDLCGLQTIYVQTIIVQDTTAPTLVGVITPVINVTCSEIPDAPIPTFTDNCGTTTFTFTSSTSTPNNDGEYQIIRSWTATDSCGNSATFTQTVNVTIPNYQLSTAIQTVCSIDISLEINLNSIVNIQFPGTPTGGTWVDNDDTGALENGIFTPYHVDNGEYTFTYLINDPVCPRSIVVTVPVNENVCTVENCVSIVVHNAMTPNNDALNEIFFIENINITECYPENNVEIYNRWGVKVFDIDNYDNATRVFTGISEGRTTVKQSAELPTGTYFYILKYKTLEGNYVTKNGYLYLSR